MEHNTSKLVMFLALLTAGYAGYLLVWGLDGKLFVYITCMYVFTIIAIVFGLLGFGVK